MQDTAVPVAVVTAEVRGASPGSSRFAGWISDAPDGPERRDWAVPGGRATEERADLSTVEALIEKDPAQAKKLIAMARESLVEALTELRDLVRGIHPTVLSERVLGDAVRALALRLPMSEVGVQIAFPPGLKAGTPSEDQRVTPPPREREDFSLYLVGVATDQPGP